MSSIKVHIVTYRRSHLLVRALTSVINQTYPNWIAEVINDDPSDLSVLKVVNELNDPRIKISQPVVHRGGTENFNYAFLSQETEYACLLEDDNWYQENFFEQMLLALSDYPNIQLACANEILWKENQDSTWTNTEKTIWKYGETGNEVEIFDYKWLDKCGSAKICNSSMFWRTKDSPKWQTPKSIPIDVTEHFRERVIPHPILLVKQPLVNYAETIASYRSRLQSEWGSYQVLLIGSVFEKLSVEGRKVLAESLWQRAFTSQKQLYTSLLMTGIVFLEARLLWSLCPTKLKFRFLATLVRRPLSSLKTLRAKVEKRDAYEFLQAYGISK